VPAIESISGIAQVKLSKGLSFDQIAKAINKDEVWLAAAFYGQVRQWKKK